MSTGKMCSNDGGNSLFISALLNQIRRNRRANSIHASAFDSSDH